MATEANRRREERQREEAEEQRRSAEQARLGAAARSLTYQDILRARAQLQSRLGAPHPGGLDHPGFAAEAADYHGPYQMADQTAQQYLNREQRRAEEQARGDLARRQWEQGGVGRFEPGDSFIIPRVGTVPATAYADYTSLPEGSLLYDNLRISVGGATLMPPIPYVEDDYNI